MFLTVRIWWTFSLILFTFKNGVEMALCEVWVKRVFRWYEYYIRIHRNAVRLRNSEFHQCQSYEYFGRFPAIRIVQILQYTLLHIFLKIWISILMYFSTEIKSLVTFEFLSTCIELYMIFVLFFMATRSIMGIIKRVIVCLHNVYLLTYK